MVIVVVNGIIHNVIDMVGFRIYIYIYIYFFFFFEKMAFEVGWAKYGAFFILQRRM